MERRKEPPEDPVDPKPHPAPPQPLPKDYYAMVAGVFSGHFEDGLKKFASQKKNAQFLVRGGLFPDEVRLSVSIIFEGQIAATTVHASADFDPKANKPTAEEVLKDCVDAIGGIFDHFFSPKNRSGLEFLAQSSFHEDDDVPFQWTQFAVGKRKVFLMVDKSNPVIDEMADQYLDS